MESNYTAKNILALEYPENIRCRPGMYIGDTDNNSAGLSQAIMELVQNSVDESLAGYCDLIKIILKSDGSAIVQDNGRGIPVDMHESGVSAAEVVMVKLHAGGKFNQDIYQTSGGLHGVGIPVVNALSEFMNAEICRDGQKYLIKFQRGIVVAGLHAIDSTEEHGTLMHFKPCNQIFANCDFIFSHIEKKLQELAFLNPGLTLTLEDERTDQKSSFCHNGGLKDYISHITKGKQTLHKDAIYIKGKSQNIFVEAIFLWTTAHSETSIAFTNTIFQQDGGTHVAGMRSAITKAVQEIISEQYTNKKLPALTGEDIREGLFSIIAIKLADPKFSSQTKDKLVSSFVRGEVESIICPKLQEALEIDDTACKSIIQKAVQSAKIREEAKLKKNEATRKNILFLDSPLPGKLADCNEKNPTLCELYITEGDGAAGTAKNGRNSKYQAVLPIRGKLLNVERATITKGINSETINNILTSIGVDFGDKCNADKARYHKIILMTDSDIDGSHIRTLLLTLFYRFMHPIIERGYLYIAQPPLYGIKRSNKIISYLKDEAALVKFLYNSFCAYGVLKINNEEIKGKTLEEMLYKAQIIYKDFKPFGEFSDIIYNYSICEDFNIQEALEAQYPDSKWIVKLNNSEAHITSICNDIEKYYKISKQSTEIHLNLYKGDLIYQGKQLPIFGPSSLHEAIYTHEKQKYTLMRFKGLGEMLAEELEETTLNPETRNLLQVTVEDAEKANDLIDKLMGNDVTFRKELIMSTSIFSIGDNY